MEAINVLIVEDNSIVAQSIATLLTKHSLRIVSICQTGEDAIHIAKERQPDLILMDVELGGAMDGISAAKIVSETSNCPIIYLSDYNDPKTVDRAKKTLPANYLSKPFNELDLIRAIDIAFTNAHAEKRPIQSRESNPSILIRSEQQYVRLFYNEILFLEADRAYCNIITEKQKHIVSVSLNHVHDQLNHTDFIRVHRKYAVNVNKITAIDGNVIKLGKHELQMSREHRDELMGRLNILK